MVSQINAKNNCKIAKQISRLKNTPYTLHKLKKYHKQGRNVPHSATNQVISCINAHELYNRITAITKINAGGFLFQRIYLNKGINQTGVISLTITHKTQNVQYF
eukprot:TRINITY_DN12856_c0_g1_i2.p4 TRINITY_DN12856_c0_g1~~TRINITY_DN12856_c0_g1_i2.p4  ORF type:complete len:104 (+),score=1.96 TRINITY_DN12856_c0_g1_i2:473-784(+)